MQLLQKFKSGEGWGKIAKDEGVKLGQVISAVERANPAFSKGKSKGMGREETSKGGEGIRSMEKPVGSQVSYPVSVLGSQVVEGVAWEAAWATVVENNI